LLLPTAVTAQQRASVANDLSVSATALTGDFAEKSLGREHITCNKNGVPFDPEKPTVTSGVRLGTSVGTTRGFGVAEFREIGRMIAEVLDGLAANGPTGNAEIEAKVSQSASDPAVPTLSNLSDLTRQPGRRSRRKSGQGTL
jgi:glycine/serine hydroxymethyltransferase